MSMIAVRPAGQRGSAVIAALLVVALVVVLAGSLVTGQERWYRQVKLEGDRLQALALADAAVDYGRAVLADDERRSVIDERNEAWAQPLPPMSVEGGLLTGSIEELQGRLNLNDVTGDARALQKLWSMLDLPAEQLSALADWIDADSEARFPGGAEDQYYLGIRRPYRAANQALVTLDDLQAVKGITAQTIELLRAHVAVYPAGNPINVNTASATVLAAVVPGLDQALAERLRRFGERDPFRTAAEFSARLAELGWRGDSVPAVSFGSRYFLVRGEVRWGDASVKMQVAVERSGAGALPGILWKRME